METVAIESLVGKDIEGVPVRLRSGHETTLIRAEYRTVKGEQWVYLLFQPYRRDDGSRSANYSGWSCEFEHGFTPSVTILDQVEGVA